MTAQEIYKAALSKIFEREGDDEDFQYFFLEFLNACLAEAMPCENSIRAAAGREELAEPQVVTSMSETVDVDARIARIALPYGVAAYYFQDDDDDFVVEVTEEDLSTGEPQESEAACCEESEDDCCQEKSE